MSGRPAAFVLIAATLVLMFRAPDVAAVEHDALASRDAVFLDELYRSLAVQRLWMDGQGPGDDAQQVFNALRYSYTEGLDPRDYHVDLIEAAWAAPSDANLHRLDRALTNGLLHYADHARYGRLGQSEMDGPSGNLAAENLSAAQQLIADVRRSDDPFSYLLGLFPQHAHYQSLKRELLRHRRMLKDGEWETVSPGPTIRPGDEDLRVPLIRRRLSAEGDYEGEATDSPRYDGMLVEAIKMFQDRHGLKVDGVIGRDTFLALEMSIAQRIRLIELNMERWRGAAHSLGERYVLVDIAGFRLYAFEGTDVRLEMPVIVGGPYHETPSFSSAIQYLVLNPFWNVPASIIRNEMLPDLIRNPRHLVDNHFRLFESWQEGARELDSTVMDWQKIGKNIVRYRIRQDPGPWNALGSIKFMMPNSHDVYLHDTPHQGLFDLPGRALSHGCIRLGDPMRLAAWATETTIDSAPFRRIESLIEAGDRHVLKLARALPVHIVYRTAWVDNDGALRFNPDVYSRDRKLAENLGL